MADVSRSVPEVVDDFTALFERQEGAEARLRQARDDQPLAWALVMAALSWDQVDRRGWRAPAVLGAQARRLMDVWGAPTESVDDADRVGAALEWATQDPAMSARGELAVELRVDDEFTSGPTPLKSALTGVLVLALLAIAMLLARIDRTAPRAPGRWRAPGGRSGVRIASHAVLAPTRRRTREAFPEGSNSSGRLLGHPFHSPNGPPSSIMFSIPERDLTDQGLPVGPGQVECSRRAG